MLVDGTKLAGQTLSNNKPDEFFSVEYPVPANVTKDKERVVVQFKAYEGKTAGGVFGCVMLKADKP